MANHPNLENNLNELISLLKSAENISQQYSGGYSGEFLSVEEFSTSLSLSISKLEKGETDKLKTVYSWFSPTSCWDDFVGMEGVELAEKICAKLKEIMKN